MSEPANGNMKFAGSGDISFNTFNVRLLDLLLST